jgi:4-amino-4-deoxy-L-arabinose transferase-like glycosyltransferase
MNTQLAEVILVWLWLGFVVLALAARWRRDARLALLVAPFLFSYPISFAWYQLWWDFGWSAPPRFLHGLPGVDGEASYDATHLEMLSFLMFTFGFIAIVAAYLRSGKKKPHKSAHTTAGSAPF